MRADVWAVWSRSTVADVFKNVSSGPRRNAEPIPEDPNVRSPRESPTINRRFDFSDSFETNCDRFRARAIEAKKAHIRVGIFTWKDARSTMASRLPRLSAKKHIERRV